MSLDLEKLENVREREAKTIARCPACAVTGHDKRGEHLILYPDGRFGCVANSGDAEHRRVIWKLAGGATDSKIPVRPVRTQFRFKILGLLPPHPWRRLLCRSTSLGVRANATARSGCSRHPNRILNFTAPIPPACGFDGIVC